ncbi:aldo/keto reductase [Actinocrispum sp. NPDC049592]|uniref:aldo/keto reductase n=1 Tax=Actinocrispum sp. NPDC049592 TaxID=3154835 RepID=UPI00341BBF80
MRLTGTAPFHQGGPRSRSTSIEVLRRAIELGVNHIDTATFYFSQTRSANELINSALSPYPKDLVIVTKVGPRRNASGAWEPPATPAELRGEVEENLRQLGLDCLDVVNLRVSRGQTSVAAHFSALAALQAEGLIRSLGVSGVTVAQLAEAQAIAPVVCVQNPFAFDRRQGRDVLDACRDQGIAFVPFFAIAGSGRDTGDGSTPSAAITDLAAARGATPAQIRLAWTLHQGPHVLAIPGTGSLTHLEENIAAATITLTPEELAALD